MNSKYSLYGVKMPVGKAVLVYPALSRIEMEIGGGGADRQDNYSVQNGERT